MGLPGAIFLVGLALLFASGWWWPGILVLIGFVTLFSGIANGQFDSALQGAIWMFGLALLAVTSWWWPGILVLIGVSALVGQFIRPHRRRWR
jgi:hypothetical protein